MIDHRLPAGTRDEARQTGNPYYYGTACRRGHGDTVLGNTRYTQTRSCVRCDRERKRGKDAGAGAYARRIEIDHRRDAPADYYLDLGV